MIKFLRLFAPVIFMLIILAGLVVFFNYPVEVKRTVIDLPTFDIAKAGDL